MLGTLPAAASGQTEEPPAGYRKWLYGAVGGLVIGVPAYVSVDFGVSGCSSRNCFAPIAAAVGAVAGFLLGAELDESATRRWVAGPRLDLVGPAFDVPLVAESMTAVPGGVALLGQAGLARATSVAVSSTYAARGLLATAVLARHEALIAASAASVVAFDQNPASRGARRVFGSGGAALSADGESRLVLGGEGTIRLLSVEGTGNDVTVTEDVAAQDPVPARSLVWQPDVGVIWELAGSRVVGRSPETLEELGSVALPGPGRALSVETGIGVVAGGESGVSVLDLSDPTTPVLLARYEGVRYAFDAEVAAGTVYVAAGEQGLVTLSLADPSAPDVTGVVGTLGQPYAVVRNGGSLFVLDRENRRLHVIETASRPRTGSP